MYLSMTEQINSQQEIRFLASTAALAIISAAGHGTPVTGGKKQNVSTARNLQ